MKKKKNIILSICLAISIIFVIAIIFIKIFNKEVTFEEAIKEKIEKINYLNLSLNDDSNLSDKYSYYLMENVGCKEYIGEDKNKFFDTLNEVYEKPFNNYSLLNFRDNESDPVMLDMANSLNGDIIYNYSVFSYIINDEEIVLYVCMPESWEFDEITDWEIVLDEKHKKVIKIGNSEISFEKKDKDWKFLYPVFLRK